MEERRLWGAVFLGLYALVLTGLELSAPGYVERVWNLASLSGLRVAGYPVEELAFAFAFGSQWASVFEHVTWQRAVETDDV